MMGTRVASPDNWSDVATVLGAGGGYSGCWCTFWRFTNQDLQGRTEVDNRECLEDLVGSGNPVGLVLYADDDPVGWTQVAPRTSFPRLFHTKGIAVADPQDASVWSIVCVYLSAAARGAGHADRLVAGAVDLAHGRGGRRIEAYPITEAGTNRRSQLSSGTVGLFTRAGFTMHAAPTGRRAVMSRAL
jgi:GNAT superfamily N-acetyltransferase